MPADTEPFDKADQKNLNEYSTKDTKPKEEPKKAEAEQPEEASSSGGSPKKEQKPQDVIEPQQESSGAGPGQQAEEAQAQAQAQAQEKQVNEAQKTAEAVVPDHPSGPQTEAQQNASVAAYQGSVAGNKGNIQSDLEGGLKDMGQAQDYVAPKKDQKNPTGAPRPVGEENGVQTFDRYRPSDVERRKGHTPLENFDMDQVTPAEAAKLRQHDIDVRNAKRQQPQPAAEQPQQTKTNIDELNEEMEAQKAERQKQKMIDWQNNARQVQDERLTEEKNEAPGAEAQTQPETDQAPTGPGSQGAGGGQAPQTYEQYRDENKKSNLSYWMGTFGDVTAATANAAGRAAQAFGTGYKSLAELAGKALDGQFLSLASDGVASLADNLTAVHDGILGEKTMIQNPDGTYREGTELEADLRNIHSPEYYHQRDKALMAEKYINSTFSRAVEDVAAGKDISQLTDDDIRRIYFTLDDYLRPELNRIKQKTANGLELDMSDKAYLNAYQGMVDAWNGYSNGIYRYRQERTKDLQATKQGLINGMEAEGEEGEGDGIGGAAGATPKGRGGGAGSVNNINVNTGGNKQQVKQDNNQQVNVIFNINGQNIPRPAFRQEDGSVVVDFDGEPETVIDANGNPTMPEVVDVEEPVQTDDEASLDEEFDEEFDETFGTDEEIQPQAQQDEKWKKQRDFVTAWNEGLKRVPEGIDNPIDVISWMEKWLKANHPEISDEEKKEYFRTLTLSFAPNRDKKQKTPQEVLSEEDIKETPAQPIDPNYRRVVSTSKDGDGEIIARTDGKGYQFMDRRGNIIPIPAGADVEPPEGFKGKNFVYGLNGKLFGEIRHTMNTNNGMSEVVEIDNNGLISDEEYIKKNLEWAEAHPDYFAPGVLKKYTGGPQTEPDISRFLHNDQYPEGAVFDVPGGWKNNWNRTNQFSHTVPNAENPDASEHYGTVNIGGKQYRMRMNLRGLINDPDFLRAMGPEWAYLNRAKAVPNGRKTKDGRSGWNQTGMVDIFAAQNVFPELGSKWTEALQKYQEVTGRPMYDVNGKVPFPKGQRATGAAPAKPKPQPAVQPAAQSLAGAPKGTKDAWGKDISGQEGFVQGKDGKWYPNVGGFALGYIGTGGTSGKYQYYPQQTFNKAYELMKANPKDKVAQDNAYKALITLCLAASLEHSSGYSQEFKDLASKMYKDVFESGAEVDPRVKGWINAGAGSSKTPYKVINPALGAKKEPAAAENGVKIPPKVENPQKIDQNAPETAKVPSNKAEIHDYTPEELKKLAEESGTFEEYLGKLGLSSDTNKIYENLYNKYHVNSAESPENASKWTVKGYETPSEKDLKDALRELSKDKRVKANGAITVKDVIEYLGLPQLKRNSPEWVDLIGAIGGAKRAMNKVEGEKVGERAQEIDEKASASSSTEAWEKNLRGLGKGLQKEYSANGILDPNMTKEEFVSKFKMPIDIDLASKNWDKVRGAGPAPAPAPAPSPEQEELPATSEREENSPEDAVADALQGAYDKMRNNLKEAYESLADPRYDRILKETRVDGINSLYDALIDPETNERAIINYASSLRKRGLEKYVKDLYKKLRK